MKELRANITIMAAFYLARLNILRVESLLVWLWFELVIAADLLGVRVTPLFSSLQLSNKC